MPPINEYDDMLSKGQAPDGGNEYFALVQDDLDAQKKAVQQSVFAAQGQDPDRKAKAIALSQKSNLPVDIVERNFDEVAKRHDSPVADYDQLVQETPKLAQWMQDPNNAALAKDDVQNLAQVEGTVKDHTLMESMSSSLKSGIAKMYANTARIPALAYDAFAVPQNLAADVLGEPSLRTRAPDWLMNNPAAKYYDDAAKVTTTPDMERSISQSISKGDYGKAGRAMAAQFLANAPQQAAIIAGTIAGWGLPTLLGAGAISAADKNKQNTDAGADPAQATLNALGHGSLETLFEHVGTFGILKKWEGAIANQYGKQVSREVFKDFGKTLAHAVAAEGNEEALTSVSQDLSDYITGINPNALQGMGQRALDAGIVGGLSGGVMTGPSAIGAGMARRSSIKRSESARNFYLAMGDTLEATKLRERLPEAQRQFVENLTKGTPVENVYLPVEVVDTFFQGAKQNPVAMMQDLGATDSYNEAKATGGDVKIPLATWAQKIVGTEYYQGLANDVKFHPNDLSVNDHQQIKSEVDAALKAEADKAQAAQKEAEVDTAAQVKENVAQQLVAAGYDEKSARTYASLFDAFRVIGERNQIDPMELFNRYGLQINRTNETVGQQSQDLHQDARPANTVEASVPEGEGQALNQTAAHDQTEQPRGRIRFLGTPGSNRTISIDLFSGADPTTFIHETGHFYLEVLGDIAHDEKASQQLKDDYQAILSWLGVKDRSEIQRDHHEQLARGFEAYAMEGKAPSQALRQAFARFRVWLVSVYKQLSSLNVNLSDEVRGVFDRMLATDAEIEAVSREQHMNPLFTDPKQMGMSDEQVYKYIEATHWAREEAAAQVNERALAPFRAARSEFWREKMKIMREEAAQEVAKLPVFSAIDKMASMPELMLSREALAQEYGKDVPKGLPKGTYTTVKNKSEGLHPSIAAEMLGFASGNELVSALTNVQDREAMIERLAHQKMVELHPELVEEPVLSDEAMKALHNEKRSQLLRMELQVLATQSMPVVKDAIRRVARRMPADQVVRDQAQQIISSRLVSDLSAHVFESAERKAAKEAGEKLAAGDIDGAFEAKRRELLNHELYRASTAAQEDVNQTLDKFKRLDRSDDELAKTRDIDLVNTARALLAGVGIGKGEKNAASFTEKIRRYDPDTYQTVSTLIDSVSELDMHHEQMKYDQFVALKDTVDAIWDLSRTTREIEINGEKMDLEQVRAELSVKLQELTKPDARVGYDRAATKWDKVKMGLLGIQASLRRVESWADALGEPFKRAIYDPVASGTIEYRAAKKAVIQKYLDIVKGVEKSLTQKEIVSPELGYRFSGKAELLGAVLHIGNESNLSKLLQGRRWGEIGQDGRLDTSRWDAFLKRAWSEGILTKADHDYVQAVWDLNEELKPQAQKAHKQLHGYYFNEITAHEVVTPFGVYRGGYVPAVADPFLSQDAAIRNEKNALEQGGNSFMFPTAGRGFTKSRVESYSAPLSLDLALVPGNIDKVLRFIHIEPRVREVARLVMDRGFRRTLDAFDPTVGGDMLVPWLQRAAQQKITSASQGWGGKAADTFFRELRSRTGLQVMTANVVNALQQVTGLSIAAVKVQPRHLRNALWEYTRGPGAMTDQVAEKSKFMSSRVTAQVMEVQQTIDDLMLNPSKYEQAREFAKKHGYFLQAGFQNVVDVMTWSGAYNQAIEGGASEADAVRSGDSAVRLTQGSFNAEDISRFETGTPFVRAFTMFYSYFNMQANLLGTEFTKVARGIGLKKGAGRLLYVYAMGFMIPAVLSELLVKAMGGGLDENDDDNYLDDLMSVFFGAQFRTATAMIPFVGTTINAGVNTFNNKWYDDKISTSPAVAMIESGVSAPHSVYKAVAEGGNQKKAIRDTLSLLGLLTGAPLAPLSRPLSYLSDVSSGKAHPTGPIDYTRGLITGKPGAKK